MISFLFSINQKLRLILSIVYLGIIVSLSLMPSDDIPEISFFEGFDKFIHVCMYLGFSWLFSWSFKTESKPLFNFFVIIFAIVLGVSMETFQNAMHLGRSFEWWDVIANSTGALFGLFIYYLMAVRVKPTNSLDNTR